ncbi:MAG: hypothetical protein II217_04780 [Alistipes sp.]|nr:hypothetical protein [Alistipes sp.]
MATSLTGGAFGFLRKSIGSITYRTSTSSIDGKLKQVASLKPTKVSNPRTIAQIVQRMKIGPAHLFYAAFEKAAGSVENNPLSHSWEGVQYGAKSRMRFLQLAMAGEPKAYVPKGIKFPVPGVYQVSQGSLQSLPWRNLLADAQGAQMLPSGSDAITAEQMLMLSNYGIEAGDQITMMYLYEKGSGSGNYSAEINRIIAAVGNKWEVQAGKPAVVLYSEGSRVNTANVACFAYIVSRGTTNNAKRSTETMLVTPNYASLLSPEAYDKAVESYLTGVSYNSLNSTWYLNQGSTQAFNGEVFFQALTLPAIEGVAEEDVIALLGRQVDGGSVRYVVFTSDGTANGTIYARRPGGISTAESWTASRAVAALGAVNVVYAQYTEAIGAQASGNA